MNIWIAIPSGDRLSVVKETIKAWQSQNFKTAIISWDRQTQKANADYFKLVDKRMSWGANQNILFDNLPTDWDVCYAGCDDHFPLENIHLIEKAVNRFSDSIICPNEGHLALCFPIITKGWFLNHSPLFDDEYIHNCVDYDICQQAAKEKKLINCPQIRFEHRHLEPSTYRNEAHSESNFVVDRTKYIKKWKSCPYIPVPTLQIKDL